MLEGDCKVVEQEYTETARIDAVKSRTDYEMALVELRRKGAS